MTFKQILSDIDYLDRHVLSYRKRATFSSSLSESELFASRGGYRLVQEMVDWIGLQNAHFYVKIAELEQGCAGQIQLQEVLGFTQILISRKVAFKTDQLTAVLAHELSHKFLRDHNIEKQETAENELLTDITSIYLGFGACVLKGIQGDEGKLGYLSFDEFAIAYDIISYRMGLTQEEAIDNLPAKAQKIIWDARIARKSEYPPEMLFTRMLDRLLEEGAIDLEDTNDLLNKLAEESTYLKSQIDDLKKRVAETAKWHTLLKDQFCIAIGSANQNLLEGLRQHIQRFSEETNKIHTAAIKLSRIAGIEVDDYKEIKEHTIVKARVEQKLAKRLIKYIVTYWKDSYKDNPVATIFALFVLFNAVVWIILLTIDYIKDTYF